MSLPALATIALALLPLRSPPQDPAPDPPSAAVQAELEDWRRLVERDLRVGFAPLTARLALEALAAPDIEPRTRAAAFLALGHAGSSGERTRLESWARRGEQIERTGAILGLGEMGPGSTGLLVEIARGDDLELAENALLALLRSRQSDAMGFVVELSGRDDEPLAASARELLAFQRDPLAGGPNVAGRLLLELRYEAARRFGLIDGKTWRVLLYESLTSDDAFLDWLVFEAAPRLKRPGVHDHLLGVVLEEGSEHGLRAAVQVIPTEIAQLVEAGLWMPAGDQWSVLLETIEERHLEGLCEPLLVHALALEGLEGWASYLLLRGGNQRGRAVLERELATAPPEERRRVVEGLGGSGNASRIGWLSVFAGDEDPSVRAAALVALARLGHEGSRDTIEILLANPELARREVSGEALIEALARGGGSPEVVAILEEALPALEGATRLRAATALAAAGRHAGAEIVRDALRAGPLAGEEGAQLVRALGRYPSVRDIELLVSLFPCEGDVEVNAALAGVLLQARVPAVTRLLRAAIWRRPFHRSVIAAGLYVDLAGVDALRQEVEAAPRTARSADLRRLGFSLGRWGGVGEVELLANRLGAESPVLQGAVLGVLASRTH